nr:putative motility protein [uncultured Oscillibacter sp.]
MMNDIAMAAMEMSSARLEMQYAMTLQKRTMTDMEQQAMGELAMLPPTPGVGDYIDTYA